MPAPDIDWLYTNNPHNRDMKILSQTSSTITENTYQLEVPCPVFQRGKQLPPNKITYIEFINSKGKLTDCIVRNEDGQENDNPVLLEEIQAFIDGNLKPQEI